MTVLDAGCLAFDLETTGPDPEEARIVQGCTAVASVDGDGGHWNAEVELVDPGVPIPEGATEIHHVTDAMVAGMVAERHYALRTWQAIRSTWEKGRPVVIFNAPYDLTVLDRALRRGGHPGIDQVGPVVDPLVIDKACDKYRPGKRTLTAMADHYGVNVPDGAAHTADGDCFTTVRIAHKQLTRLVRPGMVCDPGFPRILVDCSLSQLHDLQAVWNVEQKLSLFDHFRKKGVEVTDESTDWPIRPWRGVA